MPPSPRSQPIPPTWPRRLLGWYDRNRRDLPWRRTKDPYAIFVSEMMLQQTQVKTVLPYYDRWMTALPRWSTLARAPEGRVLKLWEGLGYYRRARNLRSAARMVMTDFSGRLPEGYEDLRKLPGVGPYSAGAVLSIAFQKPFALVDGNVIRVYARLFALRGDLKTGAGNKKVWALAERFLDRRRPGDFNQALMELGATVCHSDNPSCVSCPLRADCRAAKTGRPTAFPAPSAKARNQTVAISAAWIERDGKVLLRKRPDDARWLQGLWEFPSREGQTHRDALGKLGAELGVGFEANAAERVKHQITHHKIEIRLHRAVLPGGWVPPKDARWVGPGDWGRYALPSAHGKLRHRVAGK